MGRTFLEIIVNPIWKWWIIMPLEIIGILAFLYPDWGNVLNYPSLSRVFPWYVWVILGLIMWGIGTALEAAKKNHEKENQDSKSSVSIENKNNDGQSFAAGGNMNINAPVVFDQSIKLNSVSIIQEYRTSVTNVYSILPGQGSVGTRDSEQLTLSVKRVPTNILRNQGKDIKALALLVTSQERRKVIELKAKIDLRHSYYETELNTVFSSEYDLNSFLFWDDEKSFKKEIELRPGIQKILVICEFLKYKTSDGEKINMAIMGSDPYPESINFSKEAVFQISIMFQGKLEGEYEYRTLHYKDLFYTKPEDQRILFLEDAEKTYSDIPQELLQRGKR